MQWTWKTDVVLIAEGFPKSLSRSHRELERGEGLPHDSEDRPISSRVGSVSFAGSRRNDVCHRAELSWAGHHVAGHPTDRDTSYHWQRPRPLCNTQLLPSSHLQTRPTQLPFYNFRLPGSASGQRAAVHIVFSMGTFIGKIHFRIAQRCVCCAISLMSPDVTP